MYRHLGRGDLVFLVSGSPEHLICAIYEDLLSNENIKLIGSRMERLAGAYLLRDRCVCEEKPRMLKHRMGHLVFFESGYSDSDKDMPMLKLCVNRYRVGMGGDISEWDDIK
jgi:phosphatidylglycerophosphatase C